LRELLRIIRTLKVEAVFRKKGKVKR